MDKADYRVSVDVKVDDSKLDVLENRIKKLKNNKITVDIVVNDKAVVEAASSVSKKIKGVGTQKIKLTSNADEILKDINKVVSETKNGAVVRITTNGVNEAKQAVTVIESLNNAGKKQTIIKVSDEEVVKAKTSVQQLKEEQKQLANAMGTVHSSAVKVSNVVVQYDKLGNKTKEATVAVRKLVELQNKLDAAASAYKVDASSENKQTLINLEKSYLEQLRKTQNQVKVLANVEKDRANRLNAEMSKVNLELEKQKSILRADNWMKNNSVIKTQFTNVANEIRSIQIAIKACNDPTALSQLNKQLDITIAKAQLAGQTGLTFTDKLKMQWSRLGAYFSISTVIMSGMQGIRNMAQSVLEVDTAMTELKRVTDLTASQYSDLYDDMIVSAKEYGATLEDIINSTADWSRAGFDAETANGLAEITMMYEHIADLDYDEATENLLTAYKGFEEQLTEKFGDDAKSATNYIADIFNELDNNYAVTAAGVGEAMRRSAASMDVANNSIEETAALITGGAEVTQDYEGVGNALKVVSMRLRGSKGELEEMGEEVDENVENLTKMQGQILNLTHGKVNIFKENGDFESTYEILQGIAEVWDDLTDLEQADLLETISGKHRANTVASIIGNWENVEASYASALNSTGSAAKENEKYMDSLQGRLNNLTTAFQSFSNTAMSSDFLKGFVDMGSGILNVLDAIIDTFGLFPTLISTAVAGFTATGKRGLFKVVEDDAAMFGVKMTSIFTDIKGAFKNIDVKPVFDSDFLSNVDSGAEAINNYKNAIDRGMSSDDAFSAYLASANNNVQEYVANTDIANLSGQEFTIGERQKKLAVEASNHSLSNARSIIENFNDETRRGGLTQAQYAEAVSKGNKTLGSYLGSLKGVNSGTGAATGVFTQYIGKLVASKAATIALTVASTAMNAALTMGVSLIITGVISAISSWINREEELAESIEEATSSYKEQHDSLVKGKSDFEALAESYSKLSKGVNSLTGENISLMLDEYEEYQNVVNQIADSVPSLVKGYDEQGNAILNCAGDVDALTEAYNNLIIAENNKLLNGDGEDFGGLSDTLGDFQNDYDDLNNSNDSTLFAFWTLVDRKNSIQVSDSLEEMLGLPEINKDTLDDYVENVADFGDSIGDRFGTIGQVLRDKVSEMGLQLEGVETPDVMFATQNDWSEYIASVYEQYPEAVQAAIDDMDAQLDEAASETRTSMLAFMENAFLRGDYSNIDSEIQTIMNSIIGNLDSEFIRSIIGDLKDEEAENALTGWVNNFMTIFDGMETSVKEKFKGAFDLSGSFANDEMSLGEYKKQLGEVSDLIDSLNLDDEVKTQLKLTLNIEDVEKRYDAIVARLGKLGMKSADAFVSGLSSSELEYLEDFVINGDIDWEGKTPEQIEAEINDIIETARAASFELNITAQTEGFEKLNAAISESRSATGLTAESIEEINNRYSDLEGYDPSALFEKTTTGVRLNTKAMKSLEKQLVATNKAASEQKIAALAKQYKQLEELRDSFGKDTAEYKSYQNQLDALNDEIEVARQAAASYDGLTSSYNNWLNAKEGGQAGDIYDQVFEGREDAKTLAKEGKWGNTELQGYIEMFSAPESLDNATPEQYADKWEDAIRKSNRYIQEGTQGIDNFMVDVHKANSDLVTMNEDGTWNITPGFSVEDWAKAAGVAESTVEALFGQMEEYGFDVPIGVDTPSIEDLAEKAQSATEALKASMGEDFEIKVNTDITSAEEATSEIDRLKTQRDEINNSNATMEVKQHGVEAVNDSIEAVINKKIELEQPSYMKLDASQVKSTMSDALIALQNYQNAVDEVKRLEALQAAGISIDTSQLEEAKGNVDKMAQSLAQLDGSVKIAIGLDASDSAETVKQKIESGKVSLTIDTDIDESATEQLASNVEKIQDKNVTITVTVNGLEDVEKLNQNINLATEIDGDIDSLSRFVENAKALNGLDSTISSYVVAEVEGNVLETPEYKINNIKTFVESSKGLEDIGSPTSSVTADVHGNVIDTPEESLDNLRVYSDSAKEVGAIGEVVSSVDATVSGNVTGMAEASIDNLKSYSDNAKDVSSIGTVVSSVNATIEGNVSGMAEASIDNLKAYSDNAAEVDSIGNVSSSVGATITGNVSGMTEASIDNLKAYSDNAAEVESIGDVVSSVTANIYGNVSGMLESSIDNLKAYSENASEVDSIGNVTSSVTANIYGNATGMLEMSIDNLKTYSDSAAEVGAIGDVVSSVDATITGNVTGMLEASIDNLKVFAESAKDVGNVGDDVKVKVTADIEGNVKDTPEYKIDNLKKFIDSANGIKNIGNDIRAKITANLEGNVKDTPEYKIDNLGTFIDNANGIKNIGSDTKAKITANIEGNVKDTPEYMIDNLKTFIDSASGVKNVGSTRVKVTADIEGNVKDTPEYKIDNLGVFADNANKLKDIGSPTSTATANIEGSATADKISMLKDFSGIASALKSIGSVVVRVTANIATDAINSAISLLAMVRDSGLFKDYNSSVVVKTQVDSSSVDGYQPASKTGKVTYEVDSSKVDAWTAPPKTGDITYTPHVEALTDAQKNKTGTITYTANVVGFPVVNGTAHANGTVGRAFKQGDWSIKGSGTALMGELGPELIVRGGRFFTVGDSGAEFATYKKGDIIFNHKQTEELFKNGYVTSNGGRGRALVEGTAFANIAGGRWEPGGIGGSYSSSSSSSKSNSSSSSKSSSSSASDDAEEFEEVLDLIEIKIDRIERAISKLDLKASSTFKKWTTRNSALIKEIGKVGDEIDVQQRAYDRYMQEANSVGLSSDWVSKIQDGRIDIVTITDEDLKEKIDEYQQW